MFETWKYFLFGLWLGIPMGVFLIALLNASRDKREKKWNLHRRLELSSALKEKSLLN